MPLEKCPDKAAQVVFLQSVEFVRKRPSNYTSGVGLRTNLKYSSVSSLNPKVGSSYREKSPVVSANYRNDRSTSKSKVHESKYRLQSSLVREPHMGDTERLTHSRVMIESTEEELTTQQHKILRL